LGDAVVVRIEGVRGLGIRRVLLLAAGREAEQGAKRDEFGYWQVPLVHVNSPQHVELLVHEAPLPPQLVPC
jgi:hypothetical protein